MQLKAIFETQNSQEYKEIFNNLKEKYGIGKYKYLNPSIICEGEYTVEKRYARDVYRGKLKADIEITELELSMICDNGYSYFGGSSTIYKDRTFSVEIWTD